jgi:hypothetical protein
MKAEAAGGGRAHAEEGRGLAAVRPLVDLGPAGVIFRALGSQNR